MTAKKSSYLAFAALAVVIVYWRIDSELLAALFSFLILDLTFKQTIRVMPRSPARWISLGIFFAFSVFFIWMLTLFFRLSLMRVPEIVSSLLPRLNSFAASYGLTLPESLQDLKGIAVTAMADHAQALTKTSGLLTKSIFEIIASVIVALLFYLHATRGISARVKNKNAENLLDDFVREFGQRIGIFMEGFEKIFWIQILLAVFRSVATACFLLVMGMPWTHFLLVATFVLSVIPILGAFASSTLIIAAALSLSPHMAALTLVFLLALHETEYLFYTRLAGTGFAVPSWLILAGLLIGEKCLGLTGLILAPAVIHYLREELRRSPSSC
ncbi:MAG: AI-2E family transporter [Elusimicrobiota bacterium]